MAAPASRHARASATSSSSLIGTCGFVAFVVAPLTATSMITASDIAPVYSLRRTAMRVGGGSGEPRKSTISDATMAGCSIGRACDAPGRSPGGPPAGPRRSRTCVEADQVVVTGHHERGRRDRGQLGRRHRRLRGRHEEEAIEHHTEVLAAVRRHRRVVLVHLLGERRRRIEVEREHGVVVDVRADDDEAVHEVRAAQRDVQRHDAAVAPPDEVRRAADDRLEHADRLGRHVGVVERGVGVGRAAVAATVERHDAVALGSAGPSASRRTPLCDIPPCSRSTVSSPAPRSSTHVG